MTNFKRLLIIIILFVNSSCNSQIQNATDLTSLNANQNSNLLLKNSFNDQPENRLKASSNDQINSVDFKNFAFPVCPDAVRKIAPGMKSIKLNGSKLEIEKGQYKSNEDLTFILSNVSYSDLTGDEKKEAVVTIGIKFFQGAENCTFIYSLEKDSPKLLWTHEFGSAANGGIRKLAFEKGGLLVEEYKTEHLQATCCPTSFTRSIYIWDGKQFILKESEVLPTDIKNNLFLGYP